jgi:hypothetical protein
MPCVIIACWWTSTLALRGRASTLELRDRFFDCDLDLDLRCTLSSSSESETFPLRMMTPGLGGRSALGGIAVGMYCVYCAL